MSPKEARLFIAEDYDPIRKTLERFLSEEGHVVVVSAATAEEALARIAEAAENGVNVAVLDGSIPKDPSDGERIAKALREAIPGIRIIAIPSLPANWGDAYVGKADPRYRFTPKVVEVVGEI